MAFGSCQEKGRAMLGSKRGKLDWADMESAAVVALFAAAMALVTSLLEWASEQQFGTWQPLVIGLLGWVATMI